MSDELDVPSPVVPQFQLNSEDRKYINSYLNHQDWKLNWRQELLNRESYPLGHPNNQDNGFWEWYSKFEELNRQRIIQQGQSNKFTFDKKEERPIINKGLNWVGSKLDDARFDVVTKIVDKINDPNETGWTLPGYRYIGPGNKIFEGDDDELTETDKIAKKHDIQYNQISRETKNKPIEEIRNRTDQVDSEAIDNFWRDSHIVDDIIHLRTPHFGSLIGSAGLLAKRTYERQFGQVYPSPNQNMVRERPLKPPPDQRPNWPRLNEGQRRYAWEQYNLARVRRGLNIDHPIPIVAENNVAEAPVANNNNNHPPNDLYQEIEEYLYPSSPTAPLQELEGEHDFHNEGIDDVDILTEIANEAYDHHVPPNNNQNNIVPMDVSSSSSGAGSKRSSSGSDEGGPSKKMALPGTAKGQGGAETAGDEKTTRIGPIAKPLSMQCNDTRYFRKVHRFLSFGLAYTPLAVKQTVGQTSWHNVFMITPMAQIPWDRAFMYLNPSEFANLPPGSKITHIKCSISQRNVRVAFPTNSTATNIATLNQNKDALYAIGLQEKVPGLNVVPTSFVDNQPMIVNGITDPSTIKTPEDCSKLYDDWVIGFYGHQNDNTVFESTTPFHQFGIPFACELYYAPVTQKEDPFKSGWGNFQSHLQEFNADVTSGSHFVNVEYSPKEGLLKPPLNALYTGYPVLPTGTTSLSTAAGSNAQLPSNNVTNVKNQDNINGNVVNITKNISGATLNPVLNNEIFKITDLIEKDIMYTRGSHMATVPQVCPSLHVGVKPVQALSTSVIGANANNNFTDVQCLWECICECKVYVPHGTERALPTFENMSYADIYNKTNQTMNPQFSMIHGQYLSSLPTHIEPTTRHKRHME